MWIFLFFYVILSIDHYISACRNQIAFYRNYAEPTACAGGTFSLFLAIASADGILKTPTDWKAYVFPILFFLCFYMSWVVTYQNTRDLNAGMDPGDIWLIQINKMIWAPIIAAGVILASQSAFGKGRTNGERLDGLIGLAILYAIFDPLVNADRVVAQRNEQSVNQATQTESLK